MNMWRGSAGAVGRALSFQGLKMTKARRRRTVRLKRSLQLRCILDHGLYISLAGKNYCYLHFDCIEMLERDWPIVAIRGKGCQQEATRNFSLLLPRLRIVSTLHQPLSFWRSIIPLYLAQGYYHEESFESAPLLRFKLTSASINCLRSFLARYFGPLSQTNTKSPVMGHLDASPVE